MPRAAGAGSSAGAAALRGGDQGCVGVRLLYQRPRQSGHHRQGCLQAVPGNAPTHTADVPNA